MDESRYDYPVTDYSFRRRAWTLLTTGDWVARILIESFLVVVSILAALAVDQWRDSQEDRELATQALQAFALEIQQNQARLQDVGPYRQGLREVIAGMRQEQEIQTADEFYAIVGLEPLRPSFLTRTVWETSLTTGAIPHIDFEIVNALSLTYSLQDRLSEFSRAGMPILARGGSVPPDQMDAALREVTVYLADLGRSESELLAAYEEVLRILEGALQEAPGEEASREAGGLSEPSGTDPGG